MRPCGPRAPRRRAVRHAGSGRPAPVPGPPFATMVANPSITRSEVTPRPHSRFPPSTSAPGSDRGRAPTSTRRTAGLPSTARRPASGSPQPPPSRPPQRSRRRPGRSSRLGRCGPVPRFACISRRVPPRRRSTIRRTDPRRIPDDRPRRHQRFRPHRPAVAEGHPRARPGRGGRRRQRPRRRPDQRPAVQARLDLRRLSGRGQPHRRRASSIDGKAIKVLQVEGPVPAAVGRPRRRPRDRVDRPVHRCRQGPRPHRRRREEGDHQRPREGRGHHDRAGRQRAVRTTRTSTRSSATRAARRTASRRPPRSSTTGSPSGAA